MAELKKQCKGFYFKKTKDSVEIMYDQEIWEPVWEGTKFIKYKRK